METGNDDVTRLLEAAAAGDRDALDAVFERVYSKLKGLAHQVRGSGRAGVTLDTTALANEAYLKLVKGRSPDWKGRAHFFAVAARAMRQIVIDEARRRLAAKRGGDQAWAVTLDEHGLAAPIEAEELVAVDDALEALAGFAPRRAAVVEHRFFGGLTTAEIASVLGVSTATVEREWRAARAWLAVEIEGRTGDEP